VVSAGQAHRAEALGTRTERDEQQRADLDAGEEVEQLGHLLGAQHTRDRPVGGEHGDALPLPRPLGVGRHQRAYAGRQPHGRPTVDVQRPVATVVGAQQLDPQGVGAEAPGHLAAALGEPRLG
jgi:hypothetical protein